MDQSKNPEENYQYTTAQVAAFYGLTPKGLAFYEKKGILAPRRSSNNKYREYSLTDCYHLYDSKFYANCGFSLSEITDLIQNKDISDVESALQQKKEEMQRNILREQMMMEHIDRISEMMINLDELTHKFTLTESPPYYRLYVRHYLTPHESTEEQSAEFSHWNDDIPIDVASLKYDRDELNADQSELNVNIGSIMAEEDFRLLGYTQSERVEYLPSRLCLYTVLRGNEAELYKPERLKLALSYIQKHGYQLNGDPFTAMLIVANTEEGRIRYDEAWFPVTE